MDDGVPPHVEFVEDDDRGSTDEIRPAPGPHRRNVIVGIAALIVALGAAGWARSTNDAPAGGHASARPTVASPPPDRAIESPTLADSTYALVGPCPAGAQCFGSAPAAAAAALRAAFPGAAPVAAASILANRAGHSDPGLLRRVILAERGDLTIQVRIQAGPGPGAEPVRRPTTPHGVTRVNAQHEGYAIAVVVIGPGASGASAQATRLADDLRLIAA